MPKRGMILDEPKVDTDRLVLDQALIEALTARLAAGAEASVDASTLALRALLAEADDEHQAAMLRALWGRIAARTGPAIIAAGPVAQILAADRFGLVVQGAADAETALSKASSGAQVLIDLDNAKPWWGRLLARPDLNVVAALPDDRQSLPRALMVATTPTGPTGEDRTFWATDSTASDARIVDALGVCGFVARPLITRGGLKLFMLAGYVQVQDGRLSAAPGALKGVIGAAPIY